MNLDAMKEIEENYNIKDNNGYYYFILPKNVRLSLDELRTMSRYLALKTSPVHRETTHELVFPDAHDVEYRPRSKSYLTDCIQIHSRTEIKASELTIKAWVTTYEEYLMIDAYKQSIEALTEGISTRLDAINPVCYEDFDD